MIRNNGFSLVMLAAISFFAAQANAGLIINLDFTNFSTGAPANGSVVLGGANLSQAQGVIQTAASYWEAVFADSNSSIGWSTNVAGTLTQNISVEWGARTGSTLASGGTGWYTSDGRWSSGLLTWDNDGSSKFFVDTSPTTNSEWNQFSERDLTFNSVSVNVERVHFDAPAGVVRDNADMLSVAIHEIGHALGFLGTFPAYDASDVGNDNDVDITSGAFNGAQIGISGGHTNFVIQTPSQQFPYDPGGGSYFPLSNYGPNVMSPSIVTGTRKLLSEADIAIAAQFLQFDMSTVNFNPSLEPTSVPEPSSLSLLGAMSLMLLLRHRRRKTMK